MGVRAGPPRLRPRRGRVLLHPRADAVSAGGANRPRTRKRAGVSRHPPVVSPGASRDQPCSTGRCGRVTMNVAAARATSIAAIAVISAIVPLLSSVRATTTRGALPLLWPRLAARLRLRAGRAGALFVSTTTALNAGGRAADGALSVSPGTAL